MEVLDLNFELSQLRFRGVSLNLDEKMQLEMALHQLHTEERFNELLFWGKVTGKSLMFDNLHIFFFNLNRYQSRLLYCNGSDI